MSAETRCPECGEAVASGERCCGVRRLSRQAKTRPRDATLDAATDVVTVARTIRDLSASGEEWTLSLGLLERLVVKLRQVHDEERGS